MLPGKNSVLVIFVCFLSTEPGGNNHGAFSCAYLTTAPLFVTSSWTQECQPHWLSELEPLRTHHLGGRKAEMLYVWTNPLFLREKMELEVPSQLQDYAWGEIYAHS